MKQKIKTFTVYYTDGTVDPDSNTAGAAIFSNNYASCWRVTDNASTMQTELAAIRETLKHDNFKWPRKHQNTHRLQISFTSNTAT